MLGESRRQEGGTTTEEAGNGSENCAHWSVLWLVGGWVLTVMGYAQRNLTSLIWQVRMKEKRGGGPTRRRNGVAYIYNLWEKGTAHKLVGPVVGVQCEGASGVWRELRLRLRLPLPLLAFVCGQVQRQYCWSL